MRKTLSVLFTTVTIFLLSSCANKEEQITKIEREAENAFFDGNTEKAIELLAKGIKKHKDSAGLHRAYGQALADDGKYAEAAENLEKAITLDPELSNLWVNVGEYNALAGNNSKAIEALDKYVKVEADDFLAWKSLATLKMEANDSQGAIDAALTWNKLRPSARPALLLGDLFLQSGNSAQARSWYAQSAAYADESQAREGLEKLIQVETDNKQYLQAESRIREYEGRYGSSADTTSINEAKALITRWREAQAELARAGEELQMQRQELENKRLAMLKQAEEAKKREEEEKAEAARLAAQVEADLQVANNERNPVPLYEEAIATSAPANSAPAPANQTNTIEDANAAIMGLSSEAKIEKLWDILGRNPTPETWLAIATEYFNRNEWSDAENCILEAKRLDPLSETISAQYLKIIRHTQPKSKVLAEARKLGELFPRNESIALSIAQQMRASNESPRRVSNAYNAFLRLATPQSEGYEEATKYITTGN